MSLAERVKNARILVFDCETSPTLTYTFGMRPKWISPDKIVEPSRMICWGAKWVGKPKKTFRSEHHHSREKMLADLWDMLDKAEAVVSWNGINFDSKQIRREFFEAEMPLPRPWKEIDLFRASKQFMLESHSMRHFNERFGLSQKVQHSGFDLWRRCLAGDPAAWAEMKEYQLGDIDATEAAYHRFAGYLPSHPHIGAIDAAGTGLLCNQCGSDDLTPNGTTRAQVIDSRLYRCGHCGANVKGTRHSRAAVTRGAR